MFDYLQKQINLMNKIRLTLRVTGIIAGVSAVMSPFVFFSTLSGSSGSGGILGVFSGGLLATLFVVAGVPTGMHFMFLGLSLRGRIRELNNLSRLTQDASQFVPVLRPYLKKIGVHRIVLWVLATLILAQIAVPLGAMDQYSYSGSEGLLVGFIGAYLLNAGVQIYLGFVLQKQITDLTPALNS